MSQSKKKGKRPVIEPESTIEIAYPVTSNHFLKIFEPSKRADMGVSTAQVPVAVPTFRGRGEASPISDEEFNRAPVTDPVAEEHFEEVDSLQLRRRPRRRSSPPPGPLHYLRPKICLIEDQS